MYNVTVATKTGGIETYYWEVSKVLKQLSYKVELITGNGKCVKYEDIDVKQFNFTPRDKIINLGNRFRKLGERVSFFLNAKFYLRNKKYDIFLIHKPFDFFVCYFMKKWNPNIKTIFISGGEDFYGLDRFFSKYVDFMFAVSISNAKKIQNRYKREVKVIPNGVDIDKFKPDLYQKDILKQKYNLQDKKVLISVGRIVGWKGFQLVIESLKELKDYSYVLIGDGEYLESLKILAKKENVENRVFFLGLIDNKELPKYLNIGDIFVQPSIGHEAFGITIVEAMASGLPVVASKNGGIVDILTNSNTGYMFEIGNKKEMIIFLKKCYEKKDDFSKNALLHVEKSFTWKSCVNKLVEYIQ